MKKIKVSQKELDTVEMLACIGGMKDQRPWLGVFSCNENGRIWPQASWGWTPLEKRIYVEGTRRLLDNIAQALLEQRVPSERTWYLGHVGGGRFFIDTHGAYYRNDGSNMVQFVQFTGAVSRETQRGSSRRNSNVLREHE